MKKTKPLVVVAEDNELNLELFCDLLKLKKIDVIPVQKGNKLIEYATKYVPDLIVTDIRLGIYSGVELIKEIKSSKKLSHIPIIAITAYMTDSDRDKLNSLKCEEYLSKPLPVDEFYKVVNKYIKF